MKRARARLHEGLVGERALVGSRYLADPDLRRAYDTDLAPRTRAALAKIFAEVTQDWAVRRALDLGAGTGAAGDAIRARFGDVEVVAVDQVRAPGVIVADLSRAGRPQGVSGTFDLVVAAHLLNELPISVEARATLVRRWCDELLAPGGLCVLLEPALRETSRALLAVRDLLVAGGLFVVAPCFFQGPCPALARDRDWCHDAIQAERRVDFSYLVLRASGAASTDPTLFRVVSDRLEEKGRLRIFGCGPSGRHELVRLKRDRGAANAALDEVERGQVLQVTGDAPRIGATTTVRKLR
jgi:ribosomal protein RSM22 (predicted rRNA methylase)